MNEGVKHYWSFSVDRAVKSACIELQVQSQGKKIFWRLFLKKPFLFLHVILPVHLQSFIYGLIRCACHLTRVLGKKPYLYSLIVPISLIQNHPLYS